MTVNAMSIDNVNQENNEQEGHNSKKHLLMMVICCLLPMALIISIATLFPGAPYLGSILIFICPISMLLMMLPNWLSKN